MPSDVDIEKVLLEDGRYPLAAYTFLNEGLRRAARKRHGELTGHSQHVTGEEICLALRDMAVSRWGALAATVLGGWHIHATIDFGQMVYLLIDHDVWGRTPDDSIEDFRDVYDFNEAFAAASAFELKT